MAWSRFISVAMLRRCVDSDEWLKPSETAFFKPPKGGGEHLSCSDEDSDNRFFKPPERDSDAEPSVLLVLGMAWSRFISVAMLRRCVDSDEWLKPSETALFKPPKGGGGHLSSDEDSDNRFFMPPERDSDAEPSVLLVLGDVDVGFE